MATFNWVFHSLLVEWSPEVSAATAQNVAGSAEIGRIIFPFWWVQLRGTSALVVDMLLIQVHFLID